MASALKGMISAGFCGLTLTHSDLGGYTGIDFHGHLVSRDLEVM